MRQSHFLLLVLAACLHITGAEKCTDGDHFCVTGGFNLLEADIHLRKFWHFRTAGVAKDFHALLSQEFKYIANGVVSTAPWTDLAFLEELNESLEYSTLRMKGVVALADNSPRTIVANADWQVKVKKTGQLIKFEQANIALTYDDKGYVTEYREVVNQMGIAQLTAALTEKHDFKGIMQKWCTAISNGDISTMKGLFVQGYQMHRNGRHDTTPWTDDAFLKMLFEKTTWDVKIVNLAQNGARKATVVMSTDITVKATGQKIFWLDAWHVLLAGDGKFAQIYSTMDGAPFTALDAALSGKGKQEL